MFYCNQCAKKNGWPQNTMIRSSGRCEICEQPALCNNVPSKYLPMPNPTQAENGNTGSDE